VRINRSDATAPSSLRQAVFSHETALFFHDLTDRESSPYSITVKTGDNPSKLRAEGIRVYTIKKDFWKPSSCL